SVGHSTKSPEEHTEPRIPAPPRPGGTCLERLRARWQNAGTLLCVGLDSDFDRLPPPVRRNHTTLLAFEDDRLGAQIEGALVTFNEAIIDATADLVCAFKPNSAFYEAYGPPGLRALVRTIAYIHARYPEVPVLLDAKRGDIGSTSRAYARAAFDAFDADAVTLHPYLGHKALAPFLERADRLSFILCRTSNPGADELQELRVRADGMPVAGSDSGPLYLTVAHQVASEWNVHGNCGLVVGATYPEELRRVRAQVGRLPILVPGIGTQGGDLEATVRAGLDADGQGLIISVSRAVIYASDGLDFAAAARREALRLWREIKDLRQVYQP
ncbi:MAG TPA: orotidine-5'-phosphate decarboxylase, partial [Ktedonobacterales bacterium]|nr:orotidine-5'-phosphate decarboxylase [Ktedonobacterales bacterium]